MKNLKQSLLLILSLTLISCGELNDSNINENMETGGAVMKLAWPESARQKTDSPGHLRIMALKNLFTKKTIGFP